MTDRHAAAPDEGGATTRDLLDIPAIAAMARRAPVLLVAPGGQGRQADEGPAQEERRQSQKQRPRTWCTYEQAVTALAVLRAEGARIDGIGVMLGRLDDGRWLVGGRPRPLPLARHRSDRALGAGVDRPPAHLHRGQPERYRRQDARHLRHAAAAARLRQGAEGARRPFRRVGRSPRARRAKGTTSPRSGIYPADRVLYPHRPAPRRHARRAGRHHRGARRGRPRGRQHVGGRTGRRRSPRPSLRPSTWAACRSSCASWSRRTTSSRRPGRPAPSSPRAATGARAASITRWSTTSRGGGSRTS